MVAPSFPLLKLPLAEVRRTLLIMTPVEILKLSFLSKKCKNLMKCLNKYEQNVEVEIGENIIIKTCNSYGVNCTFYNGPNWENDNVEERRQLGAPRSVQCSWRYDEDGDDNQDYVENIDFNMRDWLEHLKYIFNCPELTELMFEDHSHQFGPDRIKEVFENCTDLRFYAIGSFHFNRRILENFLPVKQLYVAPDIFEDSKIPNQLLIQNFDLLSIDFRPEAPVILDQLTIINSKTIFLNDVMNLENMMNKFIKLWMKGSNPHLEFVLVDNSLLGAEIDLNALMNGIQRCVVPTNRGRQFKSLGWIYRVISDEAIDFFRHDGTKATIVTCLQSKFSVFMVVRSFPLLKLPADEVIRTLLIMNPVEVLNLSLLSKRAKSTVISCKLKVNRIGIYFGNEIKIDFSFPSSGIFLKFSMDHGTGPRKIIQKPMRISFFEVRPCGNPGRWFRWINFEYGLMDWVNHFRCVFNQKDTFVEFGRNTFDSNSIYENLKNPTIIHIGTTGSYEFNRQVLKSILWRDGTVTGRDMNKFLKLWKTGSNSRLEKLFIQFPGDGIYDFERIDYKLVPAKENQLRAFKSRSGETEFLSGEGKDICRFDGIRGTVCDNDGRFYFYVWHDHCIG
ncbi:unnamed protein product [Caenorhabditis brenneri]